MKTNVKNKYDVYKLLKVLKYLLYFAEFALFFVLQNLPSGFPLIFSVKPLLVLSLLISVSLIESEMSTVFFSLGAGFLLDAGVAPLGLSSLFLCIVCTFLSALSKKKFKATILSSVVSTFVVTLFYAVFIWSAVYFLPGSEKAFAMFVDRYLPMVIYTVLISPLMYILNLGIFRVFRNKH